jgi:hypothetical protein
MLDVVSWLVCGFLIVAPLPAGVAAGVAVDAWLCLRDLRAGRPVDR